MTTKTELAKALYEALITDKRNDGTEFVKLVDGSPEWMADVIRAAYGDMGPDDYRYQMIGEVAGRMAYSDDWENQDSQLCDDLVDIYNADRVKWLASHLSRAFYCDEAQDEGLVAPDTDMYQRIGIGQFMEYREIFGALVREFEQREDDEGE